MLLTHADGTPSGCGRACLRRFTSKRVNYTLDGKRLVVLLKAVILPGHEATWDRVLVTVEDITELENVRRKAALSELYARGLFEHSPVPTMG